MMNARRRAGLLVTAVMNVVFFVAVIVALRVIVDFFGVLASSSAGRTLLDLTAVLVPDLGIDPVRTPYGGVFDIEAALVVVGLLVLEWVLAQVRSRG